VIARVVALACLLASCRTAPPEARFACSGDDQCPPGMQCSEGLCYTNPPLGRDGSVDAPGPVDAGELSDSGATDARDLLDAGSACPPLELRALQPVTSDIGMPTEWTCDRTYTISGPIEVTARLRIEKGTRIEMRGTGALVVQPSGRLSAIGTAREPIVFAPPTPGARQWGGVVLLGNARVNDDAEYVMNLPDTVGRDFGGTDDAHDCGELAYVRIEGTGIETTARQAYAGLALAGCGTATSLSHVQVHQADSDGIEIYGGYFYADHVVVTDYGENTIDWSYGWRGGMQFVVVQPVIEPLGAALEGSSRNDMPGALPRSSPEFFNVTLLGRDFLRSAVLTDTGSEVEVANAVIADWRAFVFAVRDGTIQQPLIDAGGITIHDSIFWRIGAGGADYTAADGTAAAIDAPFWNLDPLLRSRGGGLDVEPTSDTGPTSRMGAVPPPPFEAMATYLGAMGYEDRWMDGWTNLP
jgi:hypothetical protein